MKLDIPDPWRPCGDPLAAIEAEALPLLLWAERAEHAGDEHEYARLASMADTVLRLATVHESEPGRNGRRTNGFDMIDLSLATVMSMMEPGDAA